MISRFSEKLTDRKPRSALRLISFAAISGSRNHGSWHEIKRLGSVPHHSSSSQSLYALTAASPASESFIRLNRRPAKPQTTEPKHSDAYTPVRSMSLSRSAGSHTPRRNSSYLESCMPHSDISRPEAPSVMWIGTDLSSPTHQGTPYSSLRTRG